MKTHRQIITSLGGPHKVGHELERIGVSVKMVTVRAWSLNNRIPAKYWTHILTIAADAGEPVTLEDLAAQVAVASVEEAA